MSIENELVKTAEVINFFANEIDQDDLQEWIDGSNLIGAEALADFLENIKKLPVDACDELNTFCEEAEEVLSCRKQIEELLQLKELNMVEEARFMRKLEEIANA